MIMPTEAVTILMESLIKNLKNVIVAIKVSFILRSNLTASREDHNVIY